MTLKLQRRSIRQANEFRRLLDFLHSYPLEGFHSCLCTNTTTCTANTTLALGAHENDGPSGLDAKQLC